MATGQTDSAMVAGSTEHRARQSGTHQHAAERGLIVAEMTGHPLPMAADLHPHINPARFLIRALKRHQI